MLSCTLVALMDVTAVVGSVIQWTGFIIPPMRARWRTVVLFWSGGNLYMCPVYTCWNSLETTLVTGSLLFVAPECRLAEVNNCVFMLRVSSVAAARLRERGLVGPSTSCLRRRGAYLPAWELHVSPSGFHRTDGA